MFLPACDVAGITRFDGLGRVVRRGRGSFSWVLLFFSSCEACEFEAFTAGIGEIQYAKMGLVVRAKLGHYKRHNAHSSLPETGCQPCIKLCRAIGDCLIWPR